MGKGLICWALGAVLAAPAIAVAQNHRVVRLEDQRRPAQVTPRDAAVFRAAWGNGYAAGFINGMAAQATAVQCQPDTIRVGYTGTDALGAQFQYDLSADLAASGYFKLAAAGTHACFNLGLVTLRSVGASGDETAMAAAYSLDQDGELIGVHVLVCPANAIGSMARSAASSIEQDVASLPSSVKFPLSTEPAMTQLPGIVKSAAKIASQ